MEKKQVTREQLVSLMAKFIKEQSKCMGNQTNMELPISISSWVCGMGRDKKWSHTDITIGYYTNKVVYTFTDKEITDDQFVYMLRKAIEESKVKGQVFADTYGDGCWTPKQTIFRHVEIYAAPCKEFVALNKMLKKYGSRTIEEYDIFRVNVCGKRSSWSDTGNRYYLCYAPQICANIMDYIRNNKLRGWKVSISTQDFFSHGDETDYKIAQYQESEWYGQRGTKLIVNINNSKGEQKLSKIFMEF